MTVGSAISIAEDRLLFDHNKITYNWDINNCVLCNFFFSSSCWTNDNYNNINNRTALRMSLFWFVAQYFTYEKKKLFRKTEVSQKLWPFMKKIYNLIGSKKIDLNKFNLLQITQWIRSFLFILMVSLGCCSHEVTFYYLWSMLMNWFSYWLCLTLLRIKSSYSNFSYFIWFFFFVPNKISKLLNAINNAALCY